MATISKEIVTFQIGHYSNFVGTHYWNLQESTFSYAPEEQKYRKDISHDVNFREGKNLSGEVTYTPRLVAFDLKGSLCTLKQEGILYELKDVEEDLPWRDDVTLHKIDKTAKKNRFLRDLESSEDRKENNDNKDEDAIIKEADQPDHTPPTDQVFGKRYYDLDDSVNVWSDFLRLHLHPKSLNIVEQSRHGEGSFDLFAVGEQLYKDSAVQRDIEDRSHFFLEECDNLQGIQLMVDMYDGFGGLASALLDEFCDDYSNKSVLIYSVTPATFPGNSIALECHRVVNSVLALDKLLSASSMFVPLSVASTLWRRPGPSRSFEYLRYKSDLDYHTSAILGAAVDSMSVPWRLESNAIQLPQLAASMLNQGRKILSLQSCLPMARRKTQTLVDYFMKFSSVPPWESLTPYCSATCRTLSQSVVCQGLGSELKGIPDPRLPSELNSCRTVSNFLQYYLQDMCSTTHNVIGEIQRPCTVTSPFPHIFDPVISVHGELTDKVRPPMTGVEEVPMMTTLQSTPEVTNYVSALVAEASKYNVKKFHKFTDNGLEEDNYKEILENLRTHIRCYEKAKCTDSDDDYDIDENS